VRLLLATPSCARTAPGARALGLVLVLVTSTLAHARAQLPVIGGWRPACATSLRAILPRLERIDDDFHDLSVEINERLYTVSGHPEQKLRNGVVEVVRRTPSLILPHWDIYVEEADRPFNGQNWQEVPLTSGWFEIRRQQHGRVAYLSLFNRHWSMRMIRHLRRLVLPALDACLAP
jgi:hypothetical protein